MHFNIVERKYVKIYGDLWRIHDVQIRRWKIQLYTVLKKGIGQLLYCHSSRGTKHSSGAYEHA